MNTRYWLIRLVPAVVILFAAAGIIGNGHHGLVGVIAGICWFGFLATALATIVLLVVAGVRRATGRPATN